MIYGRLKFTSSSLPATAQHHGMPKPVRRRLSDHFCYFLGRNVWCFGIERPTVSWRIGKKKKTACGCRQTEFFVVQETKQQTSFSQRVNQVE